MFKHKKITTILIILLVVAVIGILSISIKTRDDSYVPELIKQLRNVSLPISLMLETGDVAKLQDGKAEGYSPKGSFEYGIYLDDGRGESYTIADFNNDGLDDVAIVIGETGGGSGYFYYLTIFINENGKLKYLTSKEIGDRIKVNRIGYTSGIITVEIVTQGVNEPLCCGTTPAILKFKIVNNLLLLFKDTEDLNCAQEIINQNKAYSDDNFLLTETFDKYKVEVYSGKLAMLNTRISSTGANNFKTRINEELVKTDINFGGKYSLVSVGMTGWGENYFLIDRITGKGVIVPFRINFRDIQNNSSLLMVNHRIDEFDDYGSDGDCASTGTYGEFLPDLRPYYYVWDGKTFNPIGNPAPVNKFWKEWNLD